MYDILQVCFLYTCNDKARHEEAGNKRLLLYTGPETQGETDAQIIIITADFHSTNLDLSVSLRQFTKSSCHV